MLRGKTPQNFKGTIISGQALEFFLPMVMELTWALMGGAIKKRAGRGKVCNNINILRMLILRMVVVSNQVSP